MVEIEIVNFVPIEMKRYIVSLILFFMFSLAMFSQANNHEVFTWEDFVAVMADDTDDDYGPDSELFEELYDLHHHPINLNTAEEDELRKMFFLSDNEIKDILFYISNHKPLMSTGELMFIPSLSRQKRLMIQLFCYAGESNTNTFSFKKIFKYSKNELTLRSDFPLYTKAGYDTPDSTKEQNPNKTYLGNRLYQSIRYTFDSQNHFYAGIQLEKDPGEKYIDHHSAYAMIKNIGCIKNAIVGNYRISFGHGLVVNTGTSFGKTMKLNSLERIDYGISRHSSTAESGYLTGGAATLRFNKIQLSAFASYKNADGTFNSDSTGISSLKTDGLHRTPLEQSKKSNIHIADFGGNIHIDINRVQLSLTVANTHLDTPLYPKHDTPSSYYRLYNLQGSNFTAASIAYSYRDSKIQFSGETALNDQIAIATLNHLQWTPSPSNTLTLIQRLYQAKYHSFNARAFGENSSVNNEQGIYLGWNTSLSHAISLNTYFDFMHFPWLKSQVSAPSYGYEWMAQISYTPSATHSLTLRYRLKSKQKDYTPSSMGTTTSNKILLRFKSNHNLRLQYKYQPCDALSFKTTLIGTHIQFATDKTFGYSIGEAIRYTGTKNLRIDFSTTYFNTDDYDTRIYNYESSLLYTFGMNAYYNQGIRTTLLANWTIHPKLILTFKGSSTAYIHQHTIGTALELIEANHREDIQLQLRWKF